MPSQLSNINHFCKQSGSAARRDMDRTIAIGDIHGCAIALDTLLEAIQPGTSDTIVGMGDYVDRGMESARVLEILSNLVASTRLVPLIGNHELMMFKGLQNRGEDLNFWMSHGGNATVASYGGRTQNIPQDHLAFLSHCVRFHETDTHFFVHANYLPDVPLDEMPDEVVFWQHVTEMVPPPHINGKIAVVGHTPQCDGDMLIFDHLHVIDTYCYGDQWLSALDVESGNYWQANNQGHLRSGNLAD